MKFGRSDYNRRIVDTENKIPEDEPCFLLRGQDSLAPKLLLMWAMELRLNGGDVSMAIEAETHAQEMLKWQKDHRVKTPDMYRQSDEKKFILDSIKEDIDQIRLGNTKMLVKLQNDVKDYYDGIDSYVKVLMPMDLFHQSQDKDINDLTFDDFWFDDGGKDLFKAKLIIYCSKKGTRIFKNTIYES